MVKLIWSAETFCILGYDPANTAPLGVGAPAMHPEDLAFVQQTLVRASHDGTDMDFEHRLLLPDGSVKYVRVMAHAVRDGLGKLEFVGAVMDITAQKSSQQALEKAFRKRRF